MAIVVPNTVSAAALTALSGAGGLINGAIIMLFQNDFVPNIGMSLTDLVEATFTGYARSVAVVWTGPLDNDDGNGPVMVGDLKLFVVGATPTITNSIYGYGILNSGGTVLLAAERLAAPKQMIQAGNAIGVAAQWGAVSQAGS